MTKTWHYVDVQMFTSMLIFTVTELEVLKNMVVAPAQPPPAHQHHPGAGAGHGLGAQGEGGRGAMGPGTLIVGGAT